MSSHPSAGVVSNLASIFRRLDVAGPLGAIEQLKKEGYPTWEKQVAFLLECALEVAEAYEDLEVWRDEELIEEWIDVFREELYVMGEDVIDSVKQRLASEMSLRRKG